MIGTVLALLVQAATPAAAPGTGRQAIYDAAQAAFDKGDWAAAATGFGRILLPAGRSSRVDGMIRSRYAGAIGEEGRIDEAIDQARRAAAELKVPGRDDEYANALTSLGRLYHYQFQLGDAADAYAAARDAAQTPDLQLGAGLLAIQAAAVFDPPRAIRAADALAASPVLAAADKEHRGAFHAMRARALLNGGDAKGARAAILKAVDISGGLSTNVTYLQSVIRGDAALVYARSGDNDEARRYLAYSGGGYLPATSWWGGEGHDPPVCDEELRPNDVAVVAFRIDEQGRPVAAEAVYASRPGPIGGRFAAAVRDWQPYSDVSKLSPFWRNSLRLEMRCLKRPPALELGKPFDTELHAWGDPRDVFRRGDRPAQSPPMSPLGERIRVAVRNGDAVALDDIIADAGAPDGARAMAAFETSRAEKPGWFGNDSHVAQLDAVAARLTARPGGHRAALWLKLETALAAERVRRFAAARARLASVLVAPEAELPNGDPIRTIATLHLAMLETRAGQAAAAAERLSRAGLDAEQCNLFDVRPLPVNASISSDAFPAEALRWGMGGYVRVAYDIAADGRTDEPRTVIAYPPFVFGPAAVKAIGSFRYLPPTLDGRTVGCSSHQQNIRFLGPNG